MSWCTSMLLPEGKHSVSSAVPSLNFPSAASCMHWFSSLLPELKHSCMKSAQQKVQRVQDGNSASCGRKSRRKRDLWCHWVTRLAFIISRRDLIWQRIWLIWVRAVLPQLCLPLSFAMAVLSLSLQWNNSGNWTGNKSLFVKVSFHLVSVTVSGVWVALGTPLEDLVLNSIVFK